MSNNLTKIYRVLRQAPTKLEGVFKVTDFTRILSNVQNTKEYRAKNSQFSLEQIIKTGIVRNLTKIRSQREFGKKLLSQPNWAKLCSLTNDIPNQSTLSRWYNDERLIDVLEEIFLTLQKLIPLKRLRQAFKVDRRFEKLLKLGYEIAIVDSSILNLSPERYHYSTRVYHKTTRKEHFGAKLHFMVDLFNGYPINFVPTGAHEHDTKYVDLLVDDWIYHNNSWLKDSHKKPLIPTLILDKGYWNYKRMLNWCKGGIKFIIPRKKRMLTHCQIEFDPLPDNIQTSFSARIWKPGQEDPIYWVCQKRAKNSSQWHDLLTNIDVPNFNMIIRLYLRRWLIEEIFKFLKQLLLLQCPLGTSWDALVIHLFLVVITFLLLLYFLALTGVQRWERALTDLCIQPTSDSSVQWNITIFNAYIDKKTSL